MFAMAIRWSSKLIGWRNLRSHWPTSLVACHAHNRGTFRELKELGEREHGWEILQYRNDWWVP